MSIARTPVMPITGAPSRSGTPDDQATMELKKHRTARTHVRTTDQAVGWVVATADGTQRGHHAARSSSGSRDGAGGVGGGEP